VLSQHSPRLGGHPRSVGRFARSQAPAAAWRVKVERPQRSAAQRGRTTLTRQTAQGDWAECEASGRPSGSPLRYPRIQDRAALGGVSPP